MLYFIVNEKSRSGKGAAVWREVQETLHAEKVAYKAWVTEYEGHALALAREICARDDDDICLVALGGDGTANEVINGITDFERVRFGVIPTGSGNDMARGLGITGNPTENLKRILACMQMDKAQCRTIDLGEVRYKGGETSRLFAISSGLGLDAIVCKKALKSKLKDTLNKLHLGKLTYLLLTVQTLFSMHTTNASVRYEKKDTQHFKEFIYIAAMNFKAEGGGVPMAPSADAEDGMLSMCSVSGIPKWRTFFCLPFLVAAKHLLIRGFEVRDCAECEIHLAEPMVLHADGEYCGEVTEVRFRCLPKKLRVLLA